jgi:hypothetical protein
MQHKTVDHQGDLALKLSRLAPETTAKKLSNPYEVTLEWLAILVKE